MFLVALFGERPRCYPLHVRFPERIFSKECDVLAFLLFLTLIFFVVAFLARKILGLALPLLLIACIVGVFAFAVH